MEKRERKGKFENLKKLRFEKTQKPFLSSLTPHPTSPSPLSPHLIQMCPHDHHGAVIAQCLDRLEPVGETTLSFGADAKLLHVKNDHINGTRAKEELGGE